VLLIDSNSVIPRSRNLAAGDIMIKKITDCIKCGGWKKYAMNEKYFGEVDTLVIINVAFL
jgi:hypothetical protein